MAVTLPNGDWTAFELWTRRLVPVVSGSLRLPRVPAHGCRLVALRPRVERPQFVGSTLHFGQGALELGRETWDGEMLRLELRPVARRCGEIFVAVPRGFRVRAAYAGTTRAAFRQRGGIVSVSVAFDRPMTLRVRFARRQSSSSRRP
jgi:hypothetical protein